VSRARPLLPYALASVAIVVASAVAMAASIGVSTPATSSPSQPTASRTLSADVRLAYWRESTDGRWELWVSDLDGARRWTVAAESSIGIPSLTRWRPDGGAVAYVRERTTLVIAPLVDSELAIPLSKELTEDGRAIVGYTWSTDGARIALSMRDAGGASRESDVWSVELATGSWRRLTEMGDALAGPWIDEDELLIETMGGFIGVVLVAPRLELRPVTGMLAVSPQIGRDGRLYVAGGSGAGQFTAGGMPHGSGGIWSMALDGSDVRRERGDQASEIRLLGRWVDDRFVVSRSGSAEVLGEPRLTLPWSAGVIREFEPISDRLVIAVTGDRVLRVDPSLISPTSDLYTPSPGLTVLLDRVYDAELWRRAEGVKPLRSSGPVNGVSAPSAFVLGGTLWLVDAQGPPRQILSAGPERWIGRPTWSRDGEKLAVIVNGSDPASSELVVFARSGQTLQRAPARGDSPTWSPDGREIAMTVWAARGAEIEVREVDRIAESSLIEGHSAFWTDRGLLVVAGTPPAGAAAPSAQRVDVLGPTGRRVIVHASALAADPRLAAIGSPLSMYGVSGPPSGTYFSVNVYRVGTQRAHGVVVLRTSDGAVMRVFPSDERRGFWGAEWSPRGDLLAREVGPFPASNAEDLGRGPSVITEVLDALSGEVVATAPGRFAGWSGDGAHLYFARPEGLFRHYLAGGDGVLVSPYGVPFSISPR